MAKYITSIERIGRVEGKREAIQYLLTRRFGPLPPAAAERVAQAKREQLELWLDRLFDARTLDDLLDPDSLDYGEMRYTTSVERLSFNRVLQEGFQEELLKSHREGFRKGFLDGFHQGRTEGTRSVLSRLLTRGFGPLPTEVAERLGNAPVEQLEWWAEQIDNARKLDDVFVGR
ncbi:MULTISPECIES: DUF4351 domain-containing protein [Aromatoleum]|uniref:DUF4351 domain-containing protein n=2 Tax=Aromatoleum TaxID=551759 RepID=A0ABX1NR91_9RHOO|nr:MULTISPECIES: DUF4351 domain-containing protein [Aromatoleum]MCK0509073.1 DUF4351 domain-containing protein [Aromatoleum anaerobium]NMG14505.1 DUF4351 domain-containing protein [Aromatoleum bremense]QTQ30842.1 putative protein DUf4351 [Aromatoleum bremense]